MRAHVRLRRLPHPPAQPFAAIFQVCCWSGRDEMQRRVARRNPTPVSANRLPVRNLSSPLQGPFRLRYAREIAAWSVQIDERKRRHDQRIRLTASEAFTLGHMWGACSKMDTPIGCDDSLAAWPERPGGVGDHRCLEVAHR